jgi:RimJ/RimL family protein N-acetyltransferase
MDDSKGRKTVRLKNGKIASISFLSRGDSAKELQEHINSLIAEDAPILLDKKVTLKEEKKWKEDKLAKQNKGNGFVLVARSDGKIIGTSGATQDIGRCRNNVVLGISIRKEYRRLGLGYLLLKENITQARKRLKAKRTYLSVLSGNRSALVLYKKSGFRKMAVFPKWILYKGKYVDQIFMVLRN